MAKQTKYQNALGVNIEDDIICIACAEELANDSGKQELWWMTNMPKEFSATYVCSYCQMKLDSCKSLQAAERLTEKFKK